MDRCRVLKELSSYIDNQLSEKDKLRVQEHIQSCKICSQELSQLKLISEKLKTWQVPSLGPEFESSLTNEIVREELERGEVKMKKKTLTILIPSGVLAGILVFVFVGQVYLKSGVRGKLKGAASGIGEQYSRSSYEPYHLDSRFVEGKAAVGSRVVNSYSLANGTQSQFGISHLSPRQSISREKGSLLSRGGPQAIRPTTGYSPVPLAAEGSVIIIQPVLPATGEGEKIIRSAQVRLEVEDGKETYKRASEICQELGGYLAASNFYKDAEGREAGTITMRIPKDKFITALDRLGTLGKLENSSTDSQDVGQEYANLKSQLDAAMVVYSKMLEALQKRQTTIPEAVRLESELTPILRRIEDLKNKLEYLNNAVSFTTITVNFHEPRVSGKVLKESKRYIQENILTAAINTVRFFANAIPVAIALLIWVAVLLGIAFLVKYLVSRLLKRG